MKALHHTRRRLSAVCASLFATLLLTSCGGGDPYAGLWLGSMDGNRDVSAMVLDDGNYYMLYYRPGNHDVIAGLIQGSGDFQAASFTSTDARNFNWERLGLRGQPASLSGKVGGHQTVSGVVNRTTPFKVGFVREFDVDARLSTLVGSFQGTVVFFGGPRAATFVVTSTGQVSTTIDGCQISGQVMPRQDANAFDLNVRFGGAPCAFPGLPFSGITYYRADVDRLEAAVINSTFAQGIGFAGHRR